MSLVRAASYWGEAGIVVRRSRLEAARQFVWICLAGLGGGIEWTVGGDWIHLVVTRRVFT